MKFEASAMIRNDRTDKFCLEEDAIYLVEQSPLYLSNGAVTRVGDYQGEILHVFPLFQDNGQKISKISCSVNIQGFPDKHLPGKDLVITKPFPNKSYYTLSDKVGRCGFFIEKPALPQVSFWWEIECHSCPDFQEKQRIFNNLELSFERVGENRFYSLDSYVESGPCRRSEPLRKTALVIPYHPLSLDSDDLCCSGYVSKSLEDTWVTINDFAYPHHITFEKNVALRSFPVSHFRHSTGLYSRVCTLKKAEKRKLAKSGIEVTA